MSIWLPVDDDLPMTTPDKADVAVTQADRDLRNQICEHVAAFIKAPDPGALDFALDQLLARHRLAATPPPASAGEVRAAEQFKVSGSHLNEGEVEAVARAMQTFGIAYSHSTMADMSTADAMWRVYRVFDGNPFETAGFAWEGEFTDKREAKRLCSRLNARAAIAAMSPRVEGESVAYLKEWISEGEARSRVDRSREHEPWLDAYSPVITPLAALSTPSPEKNETIVAGISVASDLEGRLGECTKRSTGIPVDETIAALREIIADTLNEHGAQGYGRDSPARAYLTKHLSEMQVKIDTALARLPDAGEG